MTTAKYWKLPGGRYGGITKTGKRFIVDSLSKAKSKIGGAKRSRKTRRKSNPKRGVRKTARRRRRKRNPGRRKLTIPLAVVAPVGIIVADGLKATQGHRNMGDKVWAFFERITAITTGYRANERRFDMGDLSRGLLPLVVGLLIHKFVGGPPLNLNRTLSRAGVPFIRI